MSVSRNDTGDTQIKTTTEARTEVTPGGIYMISQVGNDDFAELLTKQYSKHTGRYTWEECRNPFSGTFEQVKAEATRREEWVLKNKRGR